MIANEKIVTINGEEITVYRVNNDYYGNPRYVVHYLSLGLNDYVTNKTTRKAGITKYRAKWFGGGYVIQSYSIERDLEHAIKIIKESK